MNIKQAIYELRTRFNNRFRGATDNVDTQALSGTSATITAPKDCWITVIGYADTGITLAPSIQLVVGGELINASAGVAYQGTAVSATAYVKKGTVVTVNAYRCGLNSCMIFGGGYIILAISTLSALLERRWKHEYQTDVICYMEENNQLQKPDYFSECFYNDKQRICIKPNSNSTKRNWIYVPLLDNLFNRWLDRFYIFREPRQFNNKCMGEFSNAIWDWQSKLPSIVCKEHHVVTERGCVA